MKRAVFCVSFVRAPVITSFRNVMVQVPLSHLQIGLDSVPDIVRICIKRCITVLQGHQWDAAEVSKFALVGSIFPFAFEAPHDGFSDPETIHGSF
jgi:hypothetical protein